MKTQSKNNMTAVFPQKPEDLNCANLTQLLQTAYPKAKVVDFTMTESKTFEAGSNEVSTACRVGLDVELAGENVESIHRRWVIKMCRPDLGDIPLYENEVNFYTRLRPEIEIETPACFGGVYDASERSFGIAMEDMRLRNVDFTNVTSDVSLAHMKSLLSLLATLHAQYWESPRFATDLSWLQPHTAGPIYTLFNHPGMVPAMIAQEIEANQFKRELVEGAGQTAAGLYREFRKLQQHQSMLPQTLCHGDTHIGNCYSLPDGRAGLLDWQLMARGYCLHDVTYALMTGLSVGTRRKHEGELLAYYRQQLEENGVASVPDADTIWLEYRRAAIWGVYIGWLTTPISNYGWDITVNNHIRLLTAYRDLECSAALADLPDAAAF